MKVSRRGFLRLGGLAVLGLLIRPAFDSWSGNGVARSSAAARGLVAKKWAMVIDLSACLTSDGCRDCIEACHSVHNVPALTNPKHEVKWLWKVPYAAAFPDQEHAFIAAGLRETPSLVLCNHCERPPCVSVCPTRATWQREDGIVMMDYHRCIGCRYCMAACPYGARSFNWVNPRPFIAEIEPGFPTRTRGVVEKCNFCEERLAQGLLPACVEACPHQALVFGDLANPDSEVRRLLSSRYSIRRKPGLGTEPKVYYIR